MENKTVFDFDGTLIRINSFPCWVLFLIGYSFLNFRFSIAIKVIKLLIKREIKNKINHPDFKKALMDLHFTEDYHKNFAIFLSFFVRKNLMKELKSLYKKNHKIVITSAAPEIYLTKTIGIILPEIYNDLTIIGAKIKNDHLNGNHKKEKLLNLYESGFLKQDEKVVKLFTDSWDDSEIAYHSENIILISPSTKCKRKYSEVSVLASKISFF